MAGTLALVGGAEWTEGCEFDRDLLDRSGSNRVLIVPTALAYEKPDLAVDRARTWFESLGAHIDVLDLYRRSMADDPALVELVRASRFVYLAGGSPMHLRSVLKDTAVWTAIKAVWRDGGVLAGSAEGATVLSTHMVDSRGGAFTVGLDLLARLTVIPRYDAWSEDKWHRTVRLAPAGMTVLGIDERTAAIWNGDEWSAAGAGAITVYRDGRRIELDDVASPEAGKRGSGVG